MIRVGIGSYIYCVIYGSKDLDVKKKSMRVPIKELLLKFLLVHVKFRSSLCRLLLISQRAKRAIKAFRLNTADCLGLRSPPNLSSFASKTQLKSSATIFSCELERKWFRSVKKASRSELGAQTFTIFKLWSSMSSRMLTMRPSLSL